MQTIRLGGGADCPRADRRAKASRNGSAKTAPPLRRNCRRWTRLRGGNEPLGGVVWGIASVGSKAGLGRGSAALPIKMNVGQDLDLLVSQPPPEDVCALQKARRGSDGNPPSIRLLPGFGGIRRQATVQQPLWRIASYMASGDRSAPFGQRTAPSATAAWAKKRSSRKASKTVPSTPCPQRNLPKSTRPVVPSTNRTASVLRPLTPTATSRQGACDWAGSVTRAAVSDSAA